MMPPPWWLGVGIVIWIGAWVGVIIWVGASVWPVVCR
jgi:hypothetical protein